MKIFSTIIFACLASFSANAQTNLDFEDWSTNYRDVDNAREWVNTSDATNYGAPATVIKLTENPAEGFTSAQLKTIYWEEGSEYGLDTLAGAILQQAAFNGKPENFEFSYKSFPKRGDEVLVGVRLSLTIDGVLIVVGEGIFTSGREQSTWKKENVKINYYSGLTPEIISIVALSSANATLLDGSRGHAKNGSELFVDNLRIGASKEEVKPDYYLYVFPNPAKSYINIDTNDPDAKLMEIYTLSGKKVLEKTLSPNAKTKIDLSSLSSGTFIYKVLGQDKIITTNKFNIIK
jgi:type IX secretion system substrate protein